MVAYIQWKGSLCDQCGVNAKLGMDPTTTFSVTDEVCWSCQVKETREEQLRRQAGKATQALNGVKVWISGARPTRKEATDGE